MKILQTKVINAVIKPKRTLKDLVLGSSRNNERTVLKVIEADPAIEQVANSAEVDLFLVSLDLNHVFKINANFLYVIQETEDFSFLMIPEAEKEEVSHLVNFLAVYGVGSIIEVHNILGRRRYTVEDIKNNLDEVIRFSGYVKHFRYETNNYPLPINNEMPFNSKVIYKGGYYVLELPTKEITLGDHLEYYKEVYGEDLRPVGVDSLLNYEYKDKDFMFIIRLVLAYGFNCKRIAEAFKLPYQAFLGHLVERYRYKIDSINVYAYKDAKHDIELEAVYINNNFYYNPYNVANVA